MKKLSKLAPVVILLTLFLSSCTKDTCNYSRTFTQFTPEYMSYEEFRTPVSTLAAQPLKNPGKIYFKDNYVFVNEYLKGIHVIDNGNPAAPQILGFISLPGNVDMACKGNVMYADSYTDLVSLDISNPASATQISRLQNIFEYQTFVNGVQLDPNLGVVKNWKEEVITETVQGDCNNYNNTGMLEDNMFANTTSGGVSSGGGGAGSTPTSSNGVGGSMARFATYQDYLYVVSESELMVFNTVESGAPAYERTLNIGWGIETIFPYGENLFIGSRNGMFIFDNTNPSNPTQVGEFMHITSCDPVVIEDNRAYVTLRNGTECFGYTNQLDIVDVTNLTSPFLIKSHAMFNPHGLGVDTKVVFICDGSAGLKIYDANDANNLVKVAEYPNINTYDVIPLKDRNVLLMVGEDGLFQYDYSDQLNVALLSSILVTK